jgi:MSHA biogenesis protein MshG
MAVFKYTGRDSKRKPVSGHVEGGSVYAVANQLMEGGITPIDIHQTDAIPTQATLQPGASQDIGESLRQWWQRTNRAAVTLTDLIFLSRQLYTLLKAGVPIMSALRGLLDTTENKELVRVIKTVTEGLDAGLDFSSSLKRHPEVFPPLFISLVQVGENTGNLPEAFLQLSIYLEREKGTRDSIKQAVRYPIFVIFALVVALAIINLFVIPAFANVFTSLKAELPWATRLLIATSKFTLAYWHFILLAVAGLVFVARAYVGTPKGRYRWDRIKLKLPLVGSILYKATLGRLARSLAVTLRSGVPLVQGLSVVSGAVDNTYVGERVQMMRDGVERGESLTRTATATGLFPSLVTQMLSVGEESGAVDEMLSEVAQFYEGEVDYELKHLSSAIEPILITMLGGILLVVALGVFLPMWDLAAAARNK